MPVPDFSPGEKLTAAAMDSIGLWKVASGTLSTATTNFVGCFTSDYTNYRIVIDSLNFSGTGDLYWQLLTGTTVESGNNYKWAMTGLTESGLATNSATAASTRGYTGATSQTASLVLSSSTMDVLGPNLAQRTLCMVAASGLEAAYYHRTGWAQYNQTNAYDGIRFTTATAVTVTGNVTIYGYRK
jgi:hypothetical protein